MQQVIELDKTVSHAGPEAAGIPLHYYFLHIHN